MIVINDKDEFKKLIKECLAECLIEMGVKNINMNEVRAPVRRQVQQTTQQRQQKTPAQIVAERTGQQRNVRQPVQTQAQQKDSLRNEIADRLGIRNDDILQEIFADTLRAPSIDDDSSTSVLDDPRTKQLLEGTDRWASIVEKVK